MPRNNGRTETYASEWRDTATEADLIAAAANLESAAESAREAGRPVTAVAMRNEARDIEIQRQRLLGMVSASRDCVALQTDDPAIIGLADS